MVVSQPPEVLGLLGDPLRWQLITELGRSDRRVGELVALVGKPQNLVSYHLAGLRRAGLVSGRRSSADARDVYYRADLLRCRELLQLATAQVHPGLTAVAPEPDARAPSRRRRVRVLFLCTGNSARSQIAQALFEHLGGDAVRARSAGSHPKALHPQAVRVMAERGIDIAGRTTKPLTRFARTRFDRVITLCDKVKEVCPEFPGHPHQAHWSMPDPSAEGDTETTTHAAFRRTADELDARIELLMADLAHHTHRENSYVR